MSSSIAIPTATSSGASHGHGLHRQRQHYRQHRHHLRSMNAMNALAGSPGSPGSSSMSPSLSTVSSSSASPSVPSPMSCSESPSRQPQAKGLSQSVPSAALTQKEQRMTHTRRPSLLSSAISKEEAHVINIGDPDGPPRLISYLASSQGFTWNPEIFVPSYVDCEYTPLENQREPVIEIFLSDEEIEQMLPK